MLRQLEYLVALAREKHFGRAAAACNVSQPTLSAAIRQLEEELGAPIVERGHKFHGFTAQGRAALDHAHRILAEASALKRDLEEMDRGLSGRLRIGAIPTALPIIAHITGPFYQRFPNVSVTILSLNSQQIQQGIDDFELEVGLTYLDNEPLTNVRAKPIYVEQYMFLTPAAGPYARRRSITWHEAGGAPLCLLTPDMQNRRIIDGIFRSADVSPKPAMETNSIFNLCSHVSSGLWSSIVPIQLLQFFGVPRDAKAIELVEPRAQRTIGLIMADREPPSPLARNLFAMERAANISRLIAPPVKTEVEAQ
jgi:DNA-binding transcriptional LysR family regulator